MNNNKERPLTVVEMVYQQVEDRRQKVSSALDVVQPIFGCEEGHLSIQYSFYQFVFTNIPVYGPSNAKSALERVMKNRNDSAHVRALLYVYDHIQNGTLPQVTHEQHQVTLVRIDVEDVQ